MPEHVADLDPQPLIGGRWDPDIGEEALAGEAPSLATAGADLRQPKAKRHIGPDRGSRALSAAGIDAGRQIEADDPAVSQRADADEGLIRLVRGALQAGADERIDDDIGAGRQAPPRLGTARRVPPRRGWRRRR